MSGLKDLNTLITHLCCRYWFTRGTDAYSRGYLACITQVVYVSLATGHPLARQINLSCLLQAVVAQDVKLPSVSRLEGQLLEAPAAAADPTPEAPLASGSILSSHPCPPAPLSLLC